MVLENLEKQMVRKIRAYQNPHARFLVLRDQDSYPGCCQLKQKLFSKCRESGKIKQCLVRIACRELEAFYLADLESVEQALELKGFCAHQPSRKFRSLGALDNPSRELRSLTKNVYQKVEGSRAIGKFLQLDNERSPEFSEFD